MGDTSKRLRATDLAVRRGGRELISGLSFSLDAAQIAVLVGPNGSGKTSLLRVLAGLSPAAAGEITWDGKPLHRLLPEQRAEISYRGHLDGLKKDLTVAENLEFYRSLYGSTQDLPGLLTALSIHDFAGQQLRFLSAGQRRRVGLAALKLSAAHLWILDEPMTNLDVEGRRLVSTWIDAHLASGGLAIVATHQPGEVAGSGSLMIEL